MIIERNEYVDKLMSKRWNKKVKIITGIRRCGKSFLLSTLFKQRLIEEGTPEDSFIEVALDRKSNVKFRNPIALFNYIKKQAKDRNRQYYVMIDEIQLSLKIKNKDIDESLVAPAHPTNPVERTPGGANPKTCCQTVHVCSKSSTFAAWNRLAI